MLSTKVHLFFDHDLGESVRCYDGYRETGFIDNEVEVSEIDCGPNNFCSALFEEDHIEYRCVSIFELGDIKLGCYDRDQMASEDPGYDFEGVKGMCICEGNLCNDWQRWFERTEREMDSNKIVLNQVANIFQGMMRNA